MDYIFTLFPSLFFCFFLLLHNGRSLFLTSTFERLAVSSLPSSRPPPLSPPFTAPYSQLAFHNCSPLSKPARSARYDASVLITFVSLATRSLYRGRFYNEEIHRPPAHPRGASRCDGASLSALSLCLSGSISPWSA